MVNRSFWGRNKFDEDVFRKRKFFEEDNDDFPIKCPACHNEFVEKIGTLKCTVPLCPNCGLVLHGTLSEVRYARTNHHYLTDYMSRFFFVEYDDLISQFTNKYAKRK